MKIAVISVLAAALLSACASTAPTAHPSWGYTGAGAPEHWAQLSGDYSACKGKNQSPINLTGFLKAELEPLKPTYVAGGQEILNNGHTIQVNFTPGSQLVVDGTAFELKQFHLHAPSENHINGKSFPMENHLVHADKDGNLTVLAIMYEEGEENAALAKFWAQSPKKGGDKAALAAPVDAASFAASPAGLLPLQWLADHAALLGGRALAGAQAAGDGLEGADRGFHHVDGRPQQPSGAACQRPSSAAVSA